MNRILPTVGTSEETIGSSAVGYPHNAVLRGHMSTTVPSTTSRKSMKTTPTRPPDSRTAARLRPPWGVGGHGTAQHDAQRERSQDAHRAPARNRHGHPALSVEPHLPRQPDRPAPVRRRPGKAQRSYTTSTDTIHIDMTARYGNRGNDALNSAANPHCASLRGCCRVN